ncbi:MAG: hypothetical protein H7Z75_02865 [Ferruginibacter sp.]|nr:hypothetical protein [Cytophagales bacterium]
MKTHPFLLLCLASAVAIGLNSCEEGADFAPDNTTKGLGAYPVSANTLVDLTNGNTITNNRIYATGSQLSFELQYWSDDPIQEINFYGTVGAGTRTPILKQPYVPSFSTIKSADTLVLTYRVPPVAAGTTIRLEAEIINENTLSVTRTLTIRTR